MKTSVAGLNLIAGFESLKLTAYKPTKTDPYTIGYGHTLGVTQGMKITAKQAMDFLKQDIAYVENVINKKGYKLTQNQFDALVSLFFNIGTAWIKKADFHSVLKTDPQSELIHQKFNRFVYAGGKKLTGLVIRRNKELALYKA